jgi:hypothetical protein
MSDNLWVSVAESLPPADETVLISIGTETLAGKYVPGKHLEDGIDSWLVLPSGESDVAFVAAGATHFWRPLPPSAHWGAFCPYDKWRSA